MGAFSGATDFFGMPLSQLARRYGYAEDNICILEGNLQKLREQFSETYDNLCSCTHQADQRSPLKYGQDLVASWLVEDVFLRVFWAAGLDASLDGADQGRKVLSNVKTSSSSDFSIGCEGYRRKLELMNDYTGFWARSHKMHLRDNKYLKMQREQSLFLAVSMATREFALLDFTEEIPARLIPHHIPYGNKPAYELALPSSLLHTATSAAIGKAVKERFHA